MPDIRLSRAARADLIAIWASSNETWGARQADSYLDDIDRALSGLAVHPLRGADCSDLMQGVRRLVTGRHVAFYRVEGERIFVIRVLHQSMDAWRRLRER